MLIEGVITLLIVSALFYVAPGVMYSVSKSTGTIVTAQADVGNATGLCITSGCGVIGSPAMNASQVSIGTTAAGALNLSTIGLIMLGIAIMIGGFMLIRNR